MDLKNGKIIIDITDDVFKQSYSGDKMLKGDHVEMWFGTSSNDKYQIGLNPGNFNNIKPEAMLWFNKSGAISKKPLTSVIVNSKKLIWGSLYSLGEIIWK